MISLILKIVGGLGFIWFIIPLIMYRILNIGNVTGMIVFFAIAIYGMFTNAINQIIIKLFHSGIGKVLLGILSIVTIIIFVLVIYFSTEMVLAATKQSESQNVTLVVLGCRVYGETPSIMLKERLDTAYKYLEENIEVVCVLSGGQGDGENISEAQCMYQYLTEKGLDPDRLYIEDKSTSTRENLEFSKNVIAENNLETNIAIVTNEFHEYRAGEIAESVTIEWSAIPARTAWWLFPTFYVRELYGDIYQKVF